MNEEQATLLEHRNEIGMILDSNLNISHELITMLAEKATHYYSLLEAHNKASQEMRKSHFVSKNIVNNTSDNFIVIHYLTCCCKISRFAYRHFLLI